MTENRAADEIIAELRANLEESMRLNADFEDDLRTAVQCMEDCEAERIRQVHDLSEKLNLRDQTRATEVEVARRNMQNRASELLERARDAKFRHTNSLTAYDEVANTEITFTLRVPPSRQTSTALRRSIAPLVVPSRFASRSQPHHQSREGPCDAERESFRKVGDLERENQALRQQISMLSLTDVAHRGYNAPRAKLAQAVQETVSKSLVRITSEAKDLKAAIAAAELKVRRRQVCSSNAAAAFAPLFMKAELVHVLAENLRSDTSTLLRSNCSMDELLLAGSFAAGSQEVASSQRTNSFAARSEASSPRHPARATSPKWVLVDDHTAKVNESENCCSSSM
jgi:hypothetical protein